MTSSLPTTAETMRAVVKRASGAENVVLDTVPVRETPPGFARVRVAATGICGTDVHVAHDEYRAEPPVVMGHEITGTVDLVGADDDAAWLDRRVACETYFSTCGHCGMCRSGRPNLCAERRSLGSFEDGGFARWVVMPTRNLHALPDALDDHEGALAEPLACVVQCLMDPPAVQAGDRVLVIGPGAMGQLAAQVAAAHGGDALLAGLERDADRLAVAESLGVRVTTVAPAADAFDVVLECSGSAAGAGVALRSVARGGRWVQVGIYGRPVEVDLDRVLYKEVALSSGFASTPTSWQSAMRLLENGAVRLAPLIRDRVGLDGFAEALLAAERGDGLKTVVLPD